MSSKKILKQFIDYKFFELPPSAWKCFKTAFKFGLVGDKLTFDPCILISTKTSAFDKFLLGRILNSNYVILKDTVISSICDETFKKEDEKKLLEDIKTLKEAFISVLVFPERDTSVFGDTEQVDPKVSKFLRKTGMDLKFINIINGYFSYPIWSNNFRKCEVSYSKKFEMKAKGYESMTDEEFYTKLTGYMPSSATAYAKRFAPNMLSDKRANGFEKVAYCCSNCGKLFDQYSEFSQLKCRSCGSAIELDNSGTILFSKSVRNLDEFKNYQYEKLKAAQFDDKPILRYDHLFKCSVTEDRADGETDKIDLEIFKNKLKLITGKFEETYQFKDIKHLELSFENTLILTMKNQKKFAIRGKNNENLYVICDLFKIYNEK